MASRANVPTQPPPRTDMATPRAGGPASCPANIQETQIAFGYAPQTDVATPNIYHRLWSMTKINPALSVVASDQRDERARHRQRQRIPESGLPVLQDASVAVEKYVSSEFMAWLFCFATGKATKTALGTGFTYAAVPNDPAVDCINLPPFTWDEQIRPQPNSVIDRALIGCVVGEWTLTMQSGPGRANCRVACTLPGIGPRAKPGPHAAACRDGGTLPQRGGRDHHHQRHRLRALAVLHLARVPLEQQRAPRHRRLSWLGHAERLRGARAHGIRHRARCRLISWRARRRAASSTTT